MALPSSRNKHQRKKKQNSRNIWRYQRGSQKMTYNTIEKKKTDKQ